MNDQLNTKKSPLNFGYRMEGERLGINEMRRHYQVFQKAFTDFKEYKQNWLPQMHKSIS